MVPPSGCECACLAKMMSLSRQVTGCNGFVLTDAAGGLTQMSLLAASDPGLASSSTGRNFGAAGPIFRKF
jgi:hypothetical protein